MAKRCLSLIFSATSVGHQLPITKPQCTDPETKTRREASGIIAHDPPCEFTNQGGATPVALRHRITAVPVAIAASMPLFVPAVK